MNDASAINSVTLHQDAALNTLMYMSKYYPDVPDGVSVRSIVTMTRDNLHADMQEYIADGHSQQEAEKHFSDDLRKTEVLENAVEQDPAMGNLVIANQSQNMNDPATGAPYEEGGLSACSFQDNLTNPTNVTVVFRGTSGGEWYDNGLGLSGGMVASDQQIQAQEYFDHLVEKNGWDASKPNMYVTGHSKGGNKTQYVVMTSEHSDLIINGYSLDGQCMSHEAIEHMKQVLGEEEYERRRNKLYAISADNDYVNILGVNNRDGRLIPDDHIFFLESKFGGIGWHYPDCYLNEDGTVTDFAEQGTVSKILQGISEQTMDLPVPLRGIIARGAMGIAQTLLGNGDPVNGESLTARDIMGAIPLLLEMIPGGLLEAVGNELGVDLNWLSDVVTVICVIKFAKVNLIAYGVGVAIDFAVAAVQRIVEFGQKCIEVTQKIVEMVETGIKNLQKWLKENFDKGYQYAGENPVIRLDTARMDGYAQRLRSVNTRLSNLDSRLNRLYGRVGLLGLWDLIQADALTGYSWKIRRCADYLSDTATEFENTENKLIGI